MTFQFGVVVGGSGSGLQGFLPEQNATAPVSMQIVDIPVRSRGLQGFRQGEVPTASSSSLGPAAEPFHWVFRTFPFEKKVRRSPGRFVPESPRTPARGRRRLRSWWRPRP